MKDASTSSYHWTGHLSEGHTYLNSDNDHNFYNDNDNSNDDNDNNNDIYNNDKYHYPFELGQIIRKSAFVCLLLEEFRIYRLELEVKLHVVGISELVMVSNNRMLNFTRFRPDVSWCYLFFASEYLSSLIFTLTSQLSYLLRGFLAYCL